MDAKNVHRRIVTAGLLLAITLLLALTPVGLFPCLRPLAVRRSPTSLQSSEGY